MTTTTEQVQEQTEQAEQAEKKIPLMECFGPTVQGEGSVIGLQTYFLRFGLCDYRCKMCDSMFAVDRDSVREHGKWLTELQIADVLLDHYKPNTTKWVTFSGGNPAIHDLGKLVIVLQEAGWKVAVETQGSYWNHWLLRANVVTVSPKGPGMGERLELDVLDDFIDRLWHKKGLNIKVVIFDQRDLEIAAMLYERYVLSKLLMEPEQFYLSLGNPYPPGQDPPHYVDQKNELIERYKSLLQDIQHHPILSNTKFLPQWHVLLWGNARGV